MTKWQVKRGIELEPGQMTNLGAQGWEPFSVIFGNLLVHEDDMKGRLNP